MPPLDSRTTFLHEPKPPWRSGAAERVWKKIQKDLTVAGLSLLVVATIAVFLLMGLSAKALADNFSFEPIVVPGQTDTVAFGINNLGQIAGEYGCCVGGFANHGFVLSGGSFTTVDIPGATFTNATGINNAGQLAGTYGDGNTNHGFFLSNSTLTTITPPGATLKIGRAHV